MTELEIIEIYENIRKDFEYTSDMDFSGVIKVFAEAKKAVKYKDALENLIFEAQTFYLESHSLMESMESANDILKEDHVTQRS